MRLPIIICIAIASLTSNVNGSVPTHSDKDDDTYTGDVGPNPVLVEPHKTLLPIVHVAKAVGWSKDQKPKIAAGLSVNLYTADLNHPRWLYLLPNGDVLIAETDAPTRPDDGKGLKGRFMKHYMHEAGSGKASANRITLLRDADGDGQAEIREVFLQDLNSPLGMALIEDMLYIANTDAIVRYKYSAGTTRITEPGEIIVHLPAGTINHHWTKNLIASADGKHLYVTIGSNSNVAENGIENEQNRAAILEVDIAGRKSRVFASGIRNPNGLAWNPQTKELWTVVNERDELGDHLVPDYLTSVKDGAFYGWPYSYYGQHVDTRVEPARPELVSKAISPDYALGSHTASLGLAFYEAALLPQHYSQGAFIAQHGSWNRKKPSGYKLIFVPFSDGKPNGPPEEILTGFLTDKGEALGRPVGVIVDRQGALLLADDVGNRVWRITPKIQHQ